MATTPQKPSTANNSTTPSGNAASASASASASAAPTAPPPPPPPPAEKSTSRSPTGANHAGTSGTSAPQHAPKIIVKKEPASPDLATSRHRPRRLDLSSNNAVAVGGRSGALSARPSAPLDSRDSLREVGLACLSPGFHTHDPSMREQLQRSIDVREQQRQIIEARQKTAKDPTGAGGGAGPHDAPGGEAPPGGIKSARTPSSRRKGPPPGLSITAPSHQNFAAERVVQSAPLNQSFTGLQPAAAGGPGANAGPSSLSQTSHIHHVPATQTTNRLPPISDVFAADNLHPSRESGSSSSRPPAFNHSPNRSSHAAAANQGPVRSPGFPPGAAGHPSHHGAPLTSRPREYKSAEEAVQSLTGGREELLPRLVHYGGHQPPTPPSPIPSKGHGGAGGQQHHGPGTSGIQAPPASGRRRARDEYEQDMGSPPLGRGRPGGEERRRAAPAAGLWGESRGDSPEAQKRKKEEFMSLCSRAWDLLHS
ncbi:hypothetical protein BDY21DRAFT_291174 [Lineolata rhizophorae]|uniref:Uncharacterized protein n=1 Tax=Lineolata rhizophorae TaxID=578093 RepID=A0A6A6NST7_9PEZI|nr:hypothetical protein BDY21DRAFT_291174 [Lineolata rhizophorae]